MVEEKQVIVAHNSHMLFNGDV